MLALAVVICESSPAETPQDSPSSARISLRAGGLLTPEQPSPWQAEARFIVANADELLELLGVSDVADRLHPPQLSTLVSADLLFEDGDITGHTCLTRPDLARMRPHAAPELRERINAWDAFARALEDAGQATRLIVWFIR
ncbi:hypothetical protein [Deinococcus frigens]|uniref:hypothetical protein n=1 Tax=Deinococcus frigens TaxID=249403 RepID=UPI000496733D|nr:hypothetical protein [Deinococcus frigens]